MGPGMTSSALDAVRHHVYTSEGPGPLLSDGAIWAGFNPDDRKLTAQVIHRVNQCLGYARL